MSRFEAGHHGRTEWRKGDRISPRTEFKDGHTPWNKGVQNKRIFICGYCNKEFGAWNKPKYCSKQCYANGRLGANSPLWKGGKRSDRKKEMARAAYKSWRSSIFKRDNYTCQICGVYGKYMHADHIEPWASKPNLRYDINNGRTLCRSCHYYITFKTKMPLNSGWGRNTVAEKEVIL